MKIWITRDSAFSIQCGGLERLQVWFRKPEYIESWKLDGKNVDMPFDEETVKAGIRVKSGWESPSGGGDGISKYISFGRLFGYADRKNSEDLIAEYVWEKLTEHFGNEDFNTWHEYEKNNKECSIQNFLLEIDLSINMNKL